MAAGGDARSQKAAARLGEVLKEKWRLDDLLGVGGMAAVYAATHRNGNRVAIKVLHAEFAADPEVKTRFLREGYLANKVEHPGVVRVLDDDSTDDGAVFLVMDLLEGESLETRRMRSGGALPADDVLRIAGQVLDVLALAHEKGLVHRDLKPENLFRLHDGTVKLLDFGLARARELSGKLGITQSGNTTMGTPAFMSPEQARGLWDVVDAKSDVWAFGATLFTLLTGRFVHEEPTVQDLLIAATTRPARSIASVAAGLPPGVVEVVDRALKYEAAERWPDARAMLLAVREAYRDMHVFAAPSSVPVVAQPPPGQLPPQKATLPFVPAGTTATQRHRVPGTVQSPWLLLLTGALLAIAMGLAGIFVARAAVGEKEPARAASTAPAEAASAEPDPPPAPSSPASAPAVPSEEPAAAPAQEAPQAPAVHAKPHADRPSATRPAARRRANPLDRRQ